MVQAWRGKAGSGHATIDLNMAALVAVRRSGQMAFERMRIWG